MAFTTPLLFLALLLLTTTLQTTSAKIYGMAYGRHNLKDFDSPASDASLKNLKAIGTTHLHLTAYAQTSSRYSSTIDSTPDLAPLARLIRKARKMGFKILFKPVVECRNGDWRGFIVGNAGWWKNYGNWIVTMGKFAQTEKVEMMAVGSEYRTLDQMTAMWKGVITKVRGVYKGQLTYVANHDSYNKVKFFGSLDFISLAGYFPLIGDKGIYAPGLKKTQQLWEGKAAEILSWRNANGLKGKKVVIAEVGFQARGKGMNWRRPFDFEDKSPINFSEQNLMYEAFLSVMYGKGKAWLDGVFLWNWEAVPYPGIRATDNYSPQNRPAQKTMTTYYKGGK